MNTLPKGLIGFAEALSLGFKPSCDWCLFFDANSDECRRNAPMAKPEAPSDEDVVGWAYFPTLFRTEEPYCGELVAYRENILRRIEDDAREGL